MLGGRGITRTRSPVFHQLDLTQFDNVFSARTSPAEWHRILAFRNQPTFAAALETYNALMLQYFADNVVLNRVVTEAWRFEILVYLLYLHDKRDPADPAKGLTVSNLQAICARQKCASKGRVVAILGIMRIGGFLRQQKSEADGRIKHLEPTRKFMSIVEGWNNRILRIIDAVYPSEDLARLHHDNPRLGAQMRSRGAERLLAGWKLLDPFPEVQHFLSRDGGWMLLLHCVAESLRMGCGRCIAPVAVDLEAFGKRFAVSRSHLRRLLESAHDEGLLLAPPRNGANIVLSKIAVASYLTCMASELSFYRENTVGG